MHKIIKKMCKSGLEVNANLKSKVTGLSSFCNDVSERVLSSNNIHPGFLEDCSEFLLYNYGAPQETITKLVMSIWDNFERWSFESLWNIFFYLAVKDSEMKDDMTMLFVYRFLEFIIENETTNKFTFSSMVCMAEGLIWFRIKNPIVESAFEQMLINFFDANPTKLPDVDGVITCIQLINISSNTLKQK